MSAIGRFTFVMRHDANGLPSEGKDPNNDDTFDIFEWSPRTKTWKRTRQAEGYGNYEHAKRDADARHEELALLWPVAKDEEEEDANDTVG